ncbi:hypothetical protein [Kocuria palustris]|uniref:hypothetical protein n=1 Tax=Kocuria palustris TaxID=71999 RepID=UPI0021A29965|nr:hypothetical protein [Kocuria palustris]MCT1590778.1 hypothetical protein [Kocuria palustris]
MTQSHRRGPWEADSATQEQAEPHQKQKVPARKTPQKKIWGAIVTASIVIAGAVAFINDVGGTVLLPFQARSLSDDERDPTLDSPMGIVDTPFATPFPCHFLGAFEKEPSEFENATVEDFYDSRPTPFGIGQVNFTATAEGESSYTVTDIRLVDIEQVDDAEIKTYVDAAVSACGSAGDTAVIAEYDFADPSSRQFHNLTDMSDVRTTESFPPSSVTSNSSLTIRAKVNSCDKSYRFNAEIDYTKSGSTETVTENFGPYMIYSPNHSKQLIVANQTEGTLVPGKWGKDDFVCTEKMKY